MSIESVSPEITSSLPEPQIVDAPLPTESDRVRDKTAEGLNNEDQNKNETVRLSFRTGLQRDQTDGTVAKNEGRRQDGQIAIAVDKQGFIRFPYDTRRLQDYQDQTVYVLTQDTTKGVINVSYYDKNTLDLQKLGEVEAHGLDTSHHLALPINERGNAIGISDIDSDNGTFLIARVQTNPGSKVHLLKDFIPPIAALSTAIPGGQPADMPREVPMPHIEPPAYFAPGPDRTGQVEINPETKEIYIPPHMVPQEKAKDYQLIQYWKRGAEDNAQRLEKENPEGYSLRGLVEQWAARTDPSIHADATKLENESQSLSDLDERLQIQKQALIAEYGQETYDKVIEQVTKEAKASILKSNADKPVFDKTDNDGDRIDTAEDVNIEHGILTPDHFKQLLEDEAIANSYARSGAI